MWISCLQKVDFFHFSDMGTPRFFGQISIVCRGKTPRIDLSASCTQICVCGNSASFLVQRHFEHATKSLFFSNSQEQHDKHSVDFFAMAHQWKIHSSLSMEELVDSVALSLVEVAGDFLHGFELSNASSTLHKRFVSNFGVSPCLASWLWTASVDSFTEKKVTKVHLLWTLNSLKTDDTEHQMKARWGCDEKTFRKWLHIVLEIAGSLGLVCGNEKARIIIVWLPQL